MAHTADMKGCFIKRPLGNLWCRLAVRMPLKPHPQLLSDAPFNEDPGEKLLSALSPGLLLKYWLALIIGLS